MKEKKPGRRFTYVTIQLLVAVLGWLELGVIPAKAGNHRTLPARNCAHALIIETDRDVYVAGETVFFRLYSRKEQASGKNAGLVNVVLHKGATENRVQLVMALEESGGFASFSLADTLQTGWYELLAFTNAMRGGDAQCMGRATLYVVNRFERVVSDILQEQESDAVDTVCERGLADRSWNNALQVATDRSVYDLRQYGIIRMVLHEPVYEQALFAVSVVPAASFFADLPPSEALPDFSLQTQPGEYPSEHLGLVLSGRVESNRDDLSVQGRKVLLSTPDTMVNLMYIVSDAQGRFHFQLNPGYYGRKAYVKVYEPRYDEGTFRIIPDNRFTLQTSTTVQQRAFEPGARDYILQAQQAMRIARAYELPHCIRQLQMHSEGFLKPVYGRADYTIYPADFVKLDDFQEIARELLFGLRVRRHGEQAQIRLLDIRSAPSFFSQAPLVFVNGVWVENPQNLLSLNSDAIQRIELLNRRWALGDLDFEGALALFLDPEKDFPLHRGNVLMDIPPITPKTLAECSPPKGRSAHTLPDFRPLLLWNPSLKLTAGQEKELVFTTSDMDGPFRIRVSAIMPDGSIEYFFHDFSVQPLNP